MQLSWSSPGRSLTFLDALGLGGWLGFAVAWFIPVARLPFWRCTLRRLTGWPCPGCGLTRAADHLAHLQLGKALWANPLGAVCGVAFAALAVFMVVHLGLGTRVPSLSLSERERRGLAWALLVALVLNYGWVIVTTRFPGWL